MSEPTLEQAIEAWLPCARRQIVPRFPPLLEASFQADHGRLQRARAACGRRRRHDRRCPDRPLALAHDARCHPAILWLWCLAGCRRASSAACCSWAPLPVRAQEAQTALGGVMVAGWFTAVMASTANPVSSIYLGGMLLLIMLDVVAAGFRFPVAAAYGATLTLMFGFGLTRLGAADSLPDGVLFLMMLTCTAFALFGCWRWRRKPGTATPACCANGCSRRR